MCSASATLFSDACTRAVVSSMAAVRRTRSVRMELKLRFDLRSLGFGQAHAFLQRAKLVLTLAYDFRARIAARLGGGCRRGGFRLLLGLAVLRAGAGGGDAQRQRERA